MYVPVGLTTFVLCVLSYISYDMRLWWSTVLIALMVFILNFYVVIKSNSLPLRMKACHASMCAAVLLICAESLTYYIRDNNVCR